MTKKLVVAITGASGSIYAKKLFDVLSDQDIEIHVVITDNGKAVFQYELGLDFDEWILNFKNIFIHNNTNMFAPIASGSFRTDGMVVLPCSMATIAKIANGISDTLLCRAADVTLKEKRKLVLCPRETPFSTIHLKNMLAISEASGILFPAMPAFYARPETIDDIVSASIARILDTFDIKTDQYFEWR